MNTCQLSFLQRLVLIFTERNDSYGYGVPSLPCINMCGPDKVWSSFQ